MPGAPPFLLPLWEKVARPQAVTDEGYGKLGAFDDPSPRLERFAFDQPSPTRRKGNSH
jgi:hypothetical protein